MFTLERDQDTICAIATAPGKGAIAIVRLSGQHTENIIRKIAPFLPEILESHRIYYGYILDPKTREPIDEVLISYFAKGRSFTGESSIEISCHGSITLAQQIVDALILSGARVAQKGEFTYRAFNSGRIDLVQAESVLAVIESQSGTSARLALRQLKGELSSQLHAIEDDLTWCLSRLEANLDFSSEFIEFAANEEILNRAKLSIEKMRTLIGSYKLGRVLKSGLKLAFVGCPNVGKSSLLNALAKQDRAIVSPIEGTTRDVIEVEVEMGGHRIIFADTAGLRSTQDQVEALGVQKTIQTIFDTDIICFVADATRPETITLPPEVENCSKPIIYILNKVDLAPTIKPFSFISLSTLRGDGIELLKTKILEYLQEQHEDNSVVVMNARHFEGLSRAEKHLAKGISLLCENASSEFVISELQESLLQCFEILGKQFDDQVMDRVFSEFCLGK